ncbi:MAG: hypothetical protein CMJ78_03970 [Planctomycetaceae bacterium]|nr:hypothetical protein [Planctomycetaceae bacterium]
MNDHAALIAEALEIHQAGNLDGAAAIYQRILDADPNNADARHFWGVVLYQRGQLAEAIEQIEKAIAIRPDAAIYFHNLGEVQLAANDLPAAEQAYRRAIEIRPAYPDAHNHLGVALKERGRADDAAAHIQHALQLRPDYAEAHNNLGNVRQDQTRLDDAVECYRKALQFNPNFTDAYNNLGRALLDQGQFEAATENYLRAIRMNPQHVKAYFSLSTQRSYEPQDDHIDAVRRLVELDTLPANERAFAAFALGNLLDRQKQYDDAFAAYDKANKLKDVEFDFEEHQGYIDSIIESFPSELFQNQQLRGTESDRPIFIVGMPRSGTTLGEQILCTHPHVYGAGELDAIAKVASILPQIASSEKAYPEAIADLDANAAARLAKSYLDFIAKRDSQALRVTDKMPGNFHHLGLIQLLFPNASVIYCKRHPYDVCLSCYFQNFGSVDYSFDLETLGRFYVEHERLMQYWRSVLPNTIFEVTYEDLVTNQESISRAIVEHCGLEWDDQCLRFHETSRAIKTMSVWQARQPIYKSSVARWQRYEKHIGPLREALGREP